jgi:hypothetical protein
MASHSESQPVNFYISNANISNSIISNVGGDQHNVTRDRGLTLLFVLSNLADMS